MMKLDPYLNVDPGTTNPYQHGEVFVTDNGGETDLDLGHYERVYRPQPQERQQRHLGPGYIPELIERERRGDFNGGTVQVVPHLTGAIKNLFFGVAILLVIGGTVLLGGEGDIEGLHVEAISQFPWKRGCRIPRRFT